MLAGLLDRFHYLSKGLAIILAFIGVKLIASHKTISTSIPEIPSPISLAVIIIVLAGSVALACADPPRPTPPPLRTRRRPPCLTRQPKTPSPTAKYMPSSPRNRIIRPPAS